MTNNPTIDGVSLELRLLLNSSVNGTEQEQGRARNELRALLDAPLETVNGHHPACRAVDDYKPGECSHSCAPAVERQPIKNASEVAYNLQAENARLEARITQLESEATFAAATYQAARDRIAELESGRGEAAGYLYTCPEDEYQQPEIRLADFRVRIITKGWIETPLFTASPAPVAVALPKRMKYTSHVDTSNYKDGWNACLDATAALNLTAGELN